MNTTSVTIQGVRTELLIGARYRVRYGRDSKVIQDGELTERARNGDLILIDHARPVVQGIPARFRVRPSTIDEIFGSGTEAPAETPEAVAAIEAEYDEWANAPVPDPVEDLPAALAERGVPVHVELTERGAKIIAQQMTEERKVRRITPEYAPRDPETGLLIGDHELPDLNPNPAYRTHHFIWRCPSCKRRTRAAFCSDGHAAIPSPVGYRAQDRTPDHGREGTEE